MRHRSRWWRGTTALLCGLAIWATGLVSHAANVIDVPVLQARIMDTSGTLQTEDIQLLEAELAAIETKTGSQLVVWLFPTSNGEDIAALANRAANVWKVGRRLEGDGVLMLVAKDDRRIRIEVAKALEGAIPDVMAGRVIQHEMAPRFATGDYPGGLRNGMKALAALIQAEGLPAPAERSAFKGPSHGFSWVELGAFVFFAAAIGGAMIRQALGVRVGSAVVGIGTGALVFYVSQLWWSGAIAALAGFALSLMMSRGSARSLGHPSSGFTFGSGGSSSHNPGESSAGGFRSGGGGNFGGGGASGGW